MSGGRLPAFCCMHFLMSNLENVARMLLPLALITVRRCGEPVHLRLQHWGRLAQDFWRCRPKDPGDDDDTADYIIRFKFAAAAAEAATAAPAAAPATAAPAAAAPRAAARVTR